MNASQSMKFLLIPTILFASAITRVPASSTCVPPEFSRLESFLADLRPEIQSPASSTSSFCASDKQKVLLIGIDGLRADAAAMLPLPGMRRLQAMGTWSFWASCQNEARAVSGPGWQSMLTGVEASKHKVYGNGDVRNNKESRRSSKRSSMRAKR